VEETENEEFLVMRCRDGDRAACTALVRPHMDRVRGLVRRYVKDSDDAEDVVQGAFVRAYERLALFRGESSFGTWMGRIAINAALNFLRAHRSESTSFEEDALFTQGLETSQSDTWKNVYSLFERLPPKQRLVTELRVLHGLSFAEVATMADCSEDSAKANYHSAIKRLRGLINRPTPLAVVAVEKIHGTQR
jgi:RNA polymerase sigma-70 factor (ECF subfamily)